MGIRIATALIVMVLLACGRQPGTPPATGDIGPAPGVPKVWSETSDRIFDLPYLMQELENGLQVIIVKTDYPDIVSLQIPVQTGSRNEVEPGKSGFAHFFEHMMFRGTERFPTDKYLAILKNAGADNNAYTTDDYTNYHVTFTRADLERVIEIEADRFRNLSYSEADFRTEALAIKGEYLKNASNPIQKILERARDLAFDVHPYEHTTMGFLRDIENMPELKDYADTFFDRWYRPEKTVLILIGDLDPREAFALVEKYWSGWEPGTYSADIPQEPPPAGPQHEHIAWDTPTQPWLTVSFRGPAFDPNSKDMPALDLIASIYFSESSKLYEDIVIERQLADELFAYFPNRADPNLLLIAARLTRQDVASDVRDAIYASLSRTRTDTPSSSVVDETKSRLRYQFAATLDSSATIGATIAPFVRFERTPETVNQVYRTYESLTADDLKTVAARYFVDASRVMVTLSNDESLPGVDGSVSLDALVAARASSAQAQAPVRMVKQLSATSPLVDVNLLFAVGAANDPPGKKGLAQLTAAMIADGGSQTHTVQKINEALYPLAADFDAQVDKEMTRFSSTVHKDNFERWLEIAAPQLVEPGWRDSDLERVKTQTINAIRTSLVGNNDEELAKELLHLQIYPEDHPYGSLTLGDISDIEALSIEDVQGFYREHYTLSTLTAGLAGGLDPRLADRLSEMLKRLGAGGPQELVVPPGRVPSGREALIVEKETMSVAVSFGHPVETRRGDKDWVALWLLSSWLGEHRSSNSHLYKRIREARGMNYGDYSYIEYFPNGMFQMQPNANLARQRQIFQVWLRPLRNASDALFATRVAIFELDKLINEGISEENFEATRNYLGKFVSQLTASQSRRLGYALDAGYYGTDEFPSYVRAALAGLSVEDVNRVAAKYLSSDNLSFVFVTADADELARMLGADDPTPMTYNSEKSAGLLAEDKRIEALPLAIPSTAIRRASAAKLFE